MREVSFGHAKALVAVAAVAILPIVAGIGLLSPAETLDATPMVDGPVRAIVKVGDDVWVGGRFGRVERQDGSLVDGVRNVAVFDATTGRYRDLAPKLGDAASEVWDIEPYGDDLAVAGSLVGPDGTRNNLALVDGKTGQVIRWYDAPALRSVLAAPGLGRIYGGGESLSAFDAATGRTLWTRAPAAVDPDLRSNSNLPGYRDLELDGRTIWAACICDSVGDSPARALAKLSTEGTHDASWIAEAEPEAFGLSLEERDGALYLGGGGVDFVAEYSKADGSRGWVRDTSGSTQVVEIVGDELVVGGHFWEVADQAGDACGHRSADNPSELDPNDECQRRHGLAAYSFDGTLNPDWDPKVAGRYSLVWALLADDAKLHFGGEFTKVEDNPQSFYARLSPPSGTKGRTADGR